jgi:hypothetical protein
VGPFRLNIQCRSGQVSLIGIEYSVAIRIGQAHSALNIQCKSRQVRLIGIEYSVVVLIRWAHESYSQSTYISISKRTDRHVSLRKDFKEKWSERPSALKIRSRWAL